MEKDTQKMVSLREAFYLVPKHGGFQVRKITVEEDVVLSDEPFDDPDAWEQAVSIIEKELSKKFQ